MKNTNPYESPSPVEGSDPANTETARTHCPCCDHPVDIGQVMKHMRYRCGGCSEELTVSVSRRLNAIIMIGLFFFMGLGVFAQLRSSVRLAPLVFLPYMLWIGFAIWLRYRFGHLQNKPRGFFSMKKQKRETKPNQ